MAEYIDYYKDKTILITGGAGAIGTNLVKALSDAGAKMILVLDDLSAGYLWNLPNRKNVMFVEGDIVDETALKRVFLEKIDVVYHLAAFFANQNSVDYPERDLMVNGMGTLRILEYAVLSNVKRVVYASSGCSIYGSSAPMPLKEDFISMHLTTPYQITKMLGELYSNFFNHHHGLDVVKARFFNSYGPGEVPGQYRNVIPNFIYWAMKGIPLPITGDGQATRDFTYVGDLVDGLLRAGFVKEACGQEMNLASSRETKIIDLANMINEMVDNKGGIKFFGRRKWDTKLRLLASVDRAKEMLGYEPRKPFEEGIKETIEWFKDNWDNIDKDAEFPPGMNSAVRENKEDE